MVCWFICYRARPQCQLGSSWPHTVLSGHRRSYHSLSLSWRTTAFLCFSPGVVVDKYAHQVFVTLTTLATWQQVAEHFGGICHIAVGPGWQTYSHQDAQGHWNSLLQLQGLIFHRATSPCKCRLQIHIGRHWGQSSASDCGIYKRSEIKPAWRKKQLGFWTQSLHYMIRSTCNT